MGNYRLPGVIGIVDHQKKICRPVNTFDLFLLPDTEYIYRGPIGLSTHDVLNIKQPEKGYKVENGVIVSEKIEKNISSSIEHNSLKIVNGVVLHRTDGSSAQGTLSAYKNGQKTGAHFLIGEDGKIYQTASMDKICWHVGKIRARCREENKCTKEAKIKIEELLFQKKLGYGTRISNLSKHEGMKKYPERYPNNSDSIGIEVVGLYNDKDKSFASVTVKQKKSLKWLVKILAEIYNININSDVYSHGVISYKKVSEGAELLTEIKIK